MPTLEKISNAIVGYERMTGHSEVEPPRVKTMSFWHSTKTQISGRGIKSLGASRYPPFQSSSLTCRLHSQPQQPNFRVAQK